MAIYKFFDYISQVSYEYQQCKVASDEAMLGLPNDMSWMDGVHG
ncbi:hypothetical protein ACI2IV_13320 [Psychrobacter faecalis]